MLSNSDLAKYKIFKDIDECIELVKECLNAANSSSSPTPLHEMVFNLLQNLEDEIKDAVLLFSSREISQIKSKLEDDLLSVNQDPGFKGYKTKLLLTEQGREKGWLSGVDKSGVEKCLKK